MAIFIHVRHQFFKPAQNTYIYCFRIAKVHEVDLAKPQPLAANATSPKCIVSIEKELCIIYKRNRRSKKKNKTNCEEGKSSARARPATMEITETQTEPKSDEKWSKSKSPPTTKFVTTSYNFSLLQNSILETGVRDITECSRHSRASVLYPFASRCNRFIFSIYAVVYMLCYVMCVIRVRVYMICISIMRRMNMRSTGRKQTVWWISAIGGFAVGPSFSWRPLLLLLSACAYRIPRVLYIFKWNIIFIIVIYNFQEIYEKRRISNNRCSIVHRHWFRADSWSLRRMNQMERINCYRGGAWLSWYECFECIPLEIQLKAIIWSAKWFWRNMAWTPNRCDGHQHFMFVGVFVLTDPYHKLDHLPQEHVLAIPEELNRKATMPNRLLSLVAFKPSTEGD